MLARLADRDLDRLLRRRGRQDAATFAWYDAAIRVEYAAVPEEVWRERRPRVLGTFLARERLYLTDHFHARYDAPARANLRRAIGG